MNIYTSNDIDRKHVGKRFAAGIWCWDCKITMFDEHDTEKVARINVPKQYPKCPSCGKRRPTENEGYNPALRELGFDKSKPVALTGIQGASGFIWCVDKEYGLAETKQEIMRLLEKHYATVYTEYKSTLTIGDFKEMFLQIIVEKFADGEFS